MYLSGKEPLKVQTRTLSDHEKCQGTALVRGDSLQSIVHAFQKLLGEQLLVLLAPGTCTHQGLVDAVEGTDAPGSFAHFLLPSCHPFPGCLPSCFRCVFLLATLGCFVPRLLRHCRFPLTGDTPDVVVLDWDGTPGRGGCGGFVRLC